MNSLNKKKYKKIVSFFKKLDWPTLKEMEKLRKYCKEMDIPISDYSISSRAFIPIIEKRQKNESLETILGKMFFVLLIKNEIEEFFAEYTNNERKPLIQYNEKEKEDADFFESLNYIYEKVLKIESMVKK